MRRAICTMCALTVILATGAQTYAATDIFYDRFDFYCTPNPAPNYCTTSSTPSLGALRAVWEYTAWNFNQNKLDDKGANMIHEDNQEILYTAPYGGRCSNGGDEGQHLGQNTVDLVPYIQSVIGPTYDTTNGSDAQPLVLKFYFSGGVGDGNGIMYSNGYMELVYSTEDHNPNDQAPTDYILVGANDGTGCNDCYHMCPSPNYSVHVPWPSICQSYDPRADSPHCPPLMTNVRSALAVGALAMLDKNPCHCESDDQVPQNYHLSYYDGLKWRILKSGVGAPVPGFVDDQGHPGGTTCIGTGTNDFTLGSKLNLVRFTIKTNTVEIGHSTWLTCDGTNTWVVSSAILPRQYLGAFNKLRGGTGVGCELNNGSYTCASPRRSIRMGEFRCDQPSWWQTNKSKYVSFDRVRLQDGIGSSSYGACCLNDGTCVDSQTITECEDPLPTGLGGHWQGADTSCASTSCCPYPFADADADGDVDQDDFGALQVCFTGTGGGVPAGCECFNRVTSSPEGIDGADFATFTQCWTGANVLYSVALPSGCNP